MLWRRQDAEVIHGGRVWTCDILRAPEHGSEINVAVREYLGDGTQEGRHKKEDFWRYKTWDVEKI